MTLSEWVVQIFTVLNFWKFKYHMKNGDYPYDTENPSTGNGTWGHQDGESQNSTSHKFWMLLFTSNINPILFLIVMKFTGLARTCQECKRSENLNMLPIQCLKIEKRKNEKQMMKSGSNLQGLDWETRRQMYHVDLFFLQRQ